MAWIDLPEHPQVSDIPPGTYWWKDAKDRYTIHLLGEGAAGFISARRNLRDAIIDARNWLDASGRPTPTVELQEAWRRAQQDRIKKELGID
jgi:3-oxoacyl-[acyl-carrier-protein] synthase III